MALLVFALLAAPAFASPTVWKWVDDKGVTHYSDQPVPGAQRVEISVGSRADSAPSTFGTSPSPASQAADAPANYRDFQIWKPGDQDSIVNTGGAVDVRLRFEPALQPGHSIYLYLDGRLVEDFPPAAREHTLINVPRGVHSVMAVIRDRNKTLQETPTVQFIVRQESIANPPVGPALRPTPKPRGQQAGNKLPSSQPSYAALNGPQARIDPQTNKPVRQ